ncbi:ferredoxin [Rhizobiaceae bacterium n13]|uniref:Ferredoxin n=1 Tax=Ferirhizobium litorale TaxID=2927786 RepID=A0AAE3QI34_9HYPH|nr:ferredoxin [Fererhizobium litorale]MDI7863601.1 ferredoxin [Fererhizobium litorale]MDI7923478.1 ferredoxin [Fererhizobium litorale]
MNSGSDALETIRAVLEPHGILVRGIVNFDIIEDRPLLDDGRAAQAVVLLGNVGGSLWQPFSRWREEQAERSLADPLDTWSKSTIRPLANGLGATAWFPSDPPWKPFQQWAVRAEGLGTSPLGILIHPRFGPWHGYRGALGFADKMPGGPSIVASQHPCDECLDKPCLSSCPARAVTCAGFDVGRCRAHLVTEAGVSGCMWSGCLARHACPVGEAYRYPAEQLRFHMAALSL